MQNKLNLSKPKNKKGISEVVSTMLIVVIAIGAIAILGVIIMNSIKTPLLSPTVTCNELISSSKITLENVCYNESNNEIKIKMKSSSNTPKIEELSFQLSNNGKTTKWVAGHSCNSCIILQAGETIIYYLTTDEPLQINQPNQASLSVKAGECLVGRINIDKTCNQ